jgi:acyl-CoA thioesterase I
VTYRNLSIGVVAIAIAAAGFFYFFRSTPVTNYPSKGTDIIAFGDSLVAGTGSTPGSDFVSVLSKRIGRPIINLGNPGDTTAEGLARVEDLDRYQPKVVILLFGGNDYLRHVPVNDTHKNLAALIENIQARGAIVLLLGIRGGILGDLFAGEFDTQHTTYHTAFVSDVLGGLFGNTAYMSDEVHPNDAGYAKIADRIYPVLVPLLF